MSEHAIAHWENEGIEFLESVAAHASLLRTRSNLADIEMASTLRIAIVVPGNDKLKVLTISVGDGATARLSKEGALLDMKGEPVTVSSSRYSDALPGSKRAPELGVFEIKTDETILLLSDGGLESWLADPNSFRNIIKKDHPDEHEISSRLDIDDCNDSDDRSIAFFLSKIG